MDRLVNKLNRKSKKQLQEIYYKMTNTHTNRNKKDIIKELLKPFGKTYKMGTPKYLGDIFIFYQLAMSNKIVTLLGEHHNQKCLCEQQPQISVEQYILEYLKYVPNTKILLEISPMFTSQEINNLGSFNLKNTYNALVDNGFESNIVYFDIRYFYISKYMFIIAHYPDIFNQLTRLQIINEIIVPFLNFWTDRRSSFQSENIPHEKINYITPHIQELPNGGYSGEMMKQIVDNFYMIEKEIDKLPKETIRKMLLHTWKQVMDWECIYNIFKSETDCIVLTGEQHTENYIKILKGIDDSAILRESKCTLLEPGNTLYNTFSGSVDSKGNKCLCTCISV